MYVTMTVCEKKLFREVTLTLQIARQIATAHEAARKNMIMNLFRGQAADARFSNCKQGDECQGRQKGIAAAGQHGSSTNCPGPGKVQVLWPRTRL